MYATTCCVRYILGMRRRRAVAVDGRPSRDTDEDDRLTQLLVAARREHETVGDDLMAHPFGSRRGVVDAVTRRDAVRDALRSSSDTEREVIQLRVIDRRTYHEVAVSLGCSVGAARVRASRAHACLRGVLDTSRPTVSGVA